MSKLRTRSKTERELIAWAKQNGWVAVKRNGMVHMVMFHQATGVQAIIPGKLVGAHIGRSAMTQLRKAVEDQEARRDV